MLLINMYMYFSKFSEVHAAHSLGFSVVFRRPLFDPLSYFPMVLVSSVLLFAASECAFAIIISYIL